ncbi:sigma factor-like helix-turn-helix DNA-binding protein [[Mycobacterium] crassicus]|uniref:Sigma factor-like helix-turn-helix DNA-binding protein n=1 Tax=[Mycobacterium] crassicus TaxID=2872309 RepID=A0ABU5XH88_9MYCO|nr:sigma factor-like helix-turn-helix DNA-binding protein [Mycolicibacter sp. MYC098]MEB3021489.1 sigma factor-like helix-turn-helix DNA-binding protein [Mycolicibacter sp. MYC098]
MTADDAGWARLGRQGLSPHAVSPSQHDARTQVTHALAQLSSDNRVLLGRAYFHGWTTGQIAADLGIAEATVKVQLHYALRTLQRTLRDMGVAP